jgi:hypothetical protein
MGWICLILLILWAIWMFIKNLPRIIAFGLKILAGFLFLGLCIKAWMLMSAGAAASYSFLFSNGWAILSIGVGFVSVSLVFRVCYVIYDRGNPVVVRTSGLASASDHEAVGDHVGYRATSVTEYRSPEPLQVQGGLRNGLQPLLLNDPESDPGHSRPDEQDRQNEMLDSLNEFYVRTLMRQAHEYLMEHQLLETKRNVTHFVKKTWNLTIEIPGKPSRLIEEQEAKAIFSEIATTLRQRPA